MPQAAPLLALVEPVDGAMRIAAVDAAARSAGLAPGLALAEARAMYPGLEVAHHDPMADARLLERIADWADRYTPLVGLTPPDGLMLDITGAAHLLGGEQALADDLAHRLAAQGVAARLAIAPTPGAAFALARFDDRRGIVDPEDLETALAPMPVAALRLEATIVAGLARAGLATIGDLLVRPRAPLAARFGPHLLHRLDQALGRDEEAISPRRPRPPAAVDLRLAEPITTAGHVAEAARRLCDALAAELQERQDGARHIELALFRVDGIVQRLAVRTAEPCRDAAVLHRLLVLRIDHLETPLDAGYGFDLVRLSAGATASLGAEARDLPGMGAAMAGNAARRTARLADTLAARFGLERVRRVTRHARHLPEQACRLVTTCSVGAAAPSAPPPPGIGPLRPLRLFDPPEPLDVMAAVPDGPPLRVAWRRRMLRVVAAEGPERIAPPWWEAGAARHARDYYRIADEDGRRLWVFRDGPYDATPPPCWFVHGLFA